MTETMVPVVSELGVTDADLAVFSGEGITMGCPSYPFGCGTIGRRTTSSGGPMSEIAVPAVSEIVVTDADLAQSAGERASLGCPTVWAPCR